MKAEITVTIKNTFILEIEVSDYSDSERIEDQASWLMEIQNDTTALSKLAQRESEGYEEISSKIKVIK